METQKKLTGEEINLQILTDKNITKILEELK